MEEGRKRVKAMRDKADEIRKEAWVNGAVGVVSGSAMIASAALAEQDAANAAKKESSTVAKPGETSPTANQQAVEASTITTSEVPAPSPKIDRAKLVEGGAKIFSGVGEIVAEGYRAEQQELDGDAAEHDMLAQAATRRKEEYSEQARDAREMLHKIADFLRDVRSSQNEASKAAIYRA
jgi:hypothetical protein